jgi:uncharacterized repeat protein (TIGR01451 family)
MKSLRLLPRLAAVLLAIAVVFLPEARAFKQPGHETPANFDRRQLRPNPTLSPERSAALAQLRERLPQLQIDFDEIRGTPKRIAAADGFLSGPNGQGRALATRPVGAPPDRDPHAATKAFLNEHAALFGHGAEALNTARLKREFVTAHNGMRSIIWEQQLDAIAVYEGLLMTHVTKNGELVNLSSQFLPKLPEAADAGTPNRAALEAAPAISPVQAILLAAANIGEELEAPAITSVSAPLAGGEKRQRFKAGRLPGEARVNLVWLPMDVSTLRLCWQVELTRRLGGERFRLLLDARNGEVLLRRRLTLYLSNATYRVFTSDSPSPFSPCFPTPTTNQPPLTSRSLVTLAALSTNASPLGWIGDGENETRGNNVDAHLDLDADDLPDLPRPQGSPFRVFDFPEDLTQGPTTYRSAAVVQLFYWCNWMHDQLYELGFTEAAGNFQKDNLARGGLGNDAIQADAQDGSGFNNANFTPSDDGESGRVQMYIFNGPTPNRDGDLDAEVILHECTHGLSTRLVGGGIGITALQTDGMGEGWSDFYALSLLSEPGDDLQGNYDEGSYASYQFFGLAENYYYGIRRYPYTTDLTKNPLTFKDIDPAQISPHTGVPISPVIGFSPIDAAEVHNQGEVWCVTLWEARVNLIQKYGFARGQQLMLELVMDGMKLGPPNPTFLQARDAILQADLVDNGAADYNELWRAFAKRGLGFSATSPSSSDTAGVHEAFDLPDGLVIFPATPFVTSGPAGGPFSPSCVSYLLSNNTSKSLSWAAVPKEPWLSVSPASGNLPVGSAVSVAVCLSPGANALPLGNYLGSVTFTNVTSGVGQKRAAHLRVMDFASMPFVEDFESGTLRSYWMLTGTSDFQSLVTTNYGPHGGRFHLTLDSQGSGNYARNEVTLGLDLAGYTNVMLSFWAKQFGDEPDGPPTSPFIDGADFDGVAISQDGVAWYEAQGLRDLAATNSLRVIDLDAALAAHGLAYNSRFQIRFNHFDNFSIPIDGLAIDDIAISGLAARRLIVSLPPQATEGDGTLSNAGRVTLAVPVTAAVSVSLSSTDPGKVQVPASVLIPAGASQATFDLGIVDNSLLDGPQTVVINASANGYFGQSASMLISDNERASLRLKLPRRATEGDGVLVQAGTLTASAKPDRDILVHMSSSDTNEVQVPATLLLPAGRNMILFDLTIIDDHNFDGTRQAVITAHVDNWIDGQASMDVLDNEVPVVSLLAPARVSEGDGLLANAGTIQISGTFDTNVVFALNSSAPATIVVPGTVTIPAGSTSAPFNINVVDDTNITGLRSVTLSASAPPFGVGTALVQVLDNETPPVPYQPNPPDKAVGVSLDTALSWRGGVGEIVVNGGFETGDFKGWIQQNFDYGFFVINDGLFDPDGPDGPLPPFDGKFSVMTDQIGGGTHILLQDVLIPPDASSATLSWADRIRNHAGQFAPGVQEFRVEVRDVNDNVLALAYHTRPGDLATNDWTRRSFDLTVFRGQKIRLAFFEVDHLGYFNLHLDDISVRLGEPAPTSFDVFFGTNAVPGAAQFQTNTFAQTWVPPRLALSTTYFWKIVSRRGAAQAAGPVWQFTTRGVGALDHFEWSAIAPTQFVDRPFPVTVTARDDINNAVSTFKGPVAVTGLLGTGTASAVVVTEIDTGASDKVELVNVSGRTLDLSGWQIIAYDSRSWPAPRYTFAVPTNTLSARGDLFLLSYSGTSPGFYPSFFAGTNVFWNNAAVGNPVAVLVRDGAGNLVDFVCAFDANPTQITIPMAIPSTEWLGNPIPANTNTSLTYQRVGKADHNDNSDWIVSTNTTGRMNPGLTAPFVAANPVALSPATLTNFVGGVWSGNLVVQQPVSTLLLEANDGQGHIGLSNPFMVALSNDVGVSVANVPSLALIGDELDYHFTITNSGPSIATSVTFVDPLPVGADFISVTSSQGACANVGGIVFCNLGTLAPSAAAEVQLALTASGPGTLTNSATVSRAEPDGFSGNNSASAITAVDLPLVSITNATVNEGNTGTTDEVFAVRLSAPCRLPVSVNYATSDLSAKAGQDYIATNGLLVFAPGVTAVTATVKVLGDIVYENVENFVVILSSPTNAALGISQARGRILDDDSAPRLSINDVTVQESPAGTTTNALFTIHLAGLTSFTTTVNFQTLDSTARAGTDYVAQNGTLTFPPGASDQTISVGILGNTIYKSNATFSVLLSSPFNATFVKSQGICTIQDNGATELDHFTWNLVPSPQYTGVPFIASIAAKDGRDRLKSDFSGTAALKALASSQTVSIGTAGASWALPLGSLYQDSRTQVIYLASDIGTAGRITALAVKVKTLPGQVLNNWTIRLKHTPLPGYAQAAWESAGWTTVYQAAENVASFGWVTFFFDTPFQYDGTNNLMVDFSFDNSSSSANGECFSTETKSVRSLFFQTDSAFGSPLDWSGTNSPPPSPASQTPDIQLVMEDPAPMASANPVQFTQGAWSGPITITLPITNVFLRVTDSTGHVGIGNNFAVDSSTDLNGNGLPDAWELRYFGANHPPGSGPNDDPDGDGLTNLEEFRAGTNPLDASSGLRLVATRQDAFTVLLDFPTIGGKSYRLERTDDLSGNSWTIIADNVVGTGAHMQLTDAPGVGQRARFYRLRLLP